MNSEVHGVSGTDISAPPPANSGSIEEVPSMLTLKESVTCQNYLKRSGSVDLTLFLKAATKASE